MTHPIDTTPEAIAALLDGVTPGPWRAVAAGGHDQLNEVVSDTPFVSVADADGANVSFIAAARDLVPALAAEIARLTTERDAAWNAAIRAAAEACDWGDIYGDNAVRAILALLKPEEKA